MSLTHDDVNRILAILDEADCEEADIEVGDFKLHLKRRSDASSDGKKPTVPEEGVTRSAGDFDGKD